MAEAELRLKFRTGGLEAAAFPSVRGARRLDRRGAGPGDRRSSARPACTARSGTPATDGFEHHGFLNVLVATRRAFDGASRDEVVDVLEERDARGD